MVSSLVANRCLPVTGLLFTLKGLQLVLLFLWVSRCEGEQADTWEQEEQTRDAGEEQRTQDMVREQSYNLTRHNVYFPHMGCTEGDQ